MMSKWLFISSLDSVVLFQLNSKNSRKQAENYFQSKF